MGNGSPAFLVYLDQNIYSRLREGSPDRENMLGILNAIAQKGAQFVYSNIHIEECRASDRPESFVEAIETVSSYWLDPSSEGNLTLGLSPDRARELICAEWTFAEGVEHLINSLIHVMQFAVGWLGEHEAEDLRIDLEDEVDAVLAAWERHDPDICAIMAPMMKEQVVEIIRGIDLQDLKDEAQPRQANLKMRLPQNYAQLDEKPNDAVVEYLFSCLDSEERDSVLKQFPRGFWSDIPQREEGALAAFTFMLFLMGLTREPEAKSKQISKRKKHFIGQFRDCRDIEIAARCAVFATLDKGAARLASAAYAYAGAKTMVIHLKKKGEPSGPPLS